MPPKKIGYAFFAMNFVKLHHIYKNDNTIISRKNLTNFVDFSTKRGGGEGFTTKIIWQNWGKNTCPWLWPFVGCCKMGSMCHLLIFCINFLTFRTCCKNCHHLMLNPSWDGHIWYDTRIMKKNTNWNISTITIIIIIIQFCDIVQLAIIHKYI